MQRRSCHFLAARPIASFGPPATVSSVFAMHARRPEDSCTHFATRAAGSARFVLIGESFHGANGPCGLGGLRFVALLLSEQLLGLLAVELVDGVALDVRIEYFQGPAAGIDFVVVGEFGKPFEPHLHIVFPPDLSALAWSPLSSY